MRKAFALLITVLATVAVAQAPASPATVSTDLILELLGTGHAIEIQIPSQVERVLLYGIQGDEVRLEQDRIISGQVRTGRGNSIKAVASAGALNGNGGCAVLAFAQIALSDAEGREFLVGTRRHCLHEGTNHAVRSGPQPALKLSSARHELPLDTWLPFQAVWFRTDDQPVGTPDDLSNVLIYYLFLDTSGDDLPDLPAYSDWSELQSAYRPEIQESR